MHEGQSMWLSVSGFFGIGGFRESMAVSWLCRKCIVIASGGCHGCAEANSPGVSEFSGWFYQS
jgi:hypothetical protein